MLGLRLHVMAVQASLTRVRHQGPWLGQPPWRRSKMGEGGSPRDSESNDRDCIVDLEQSRWSQWIWSAFLAGANRAIPPKVEEIRPSAEMRGYLHGGFGAEAGEASRRGNQGGPLPRTIARNPVGSERPNCKARIS